MDEPERVFQHLLDENYSQLQEYQIQQKIRNDFKIKVDAILSFQLFITFLVIYISFSNQNIYDFLAYCSTNLTIICAIISFSLLFFPACDRYIYRKVPYNHVIITIFTLIFSVVLTAEIYRFSEIIIFF